MTAPASKVAAPITGTPAATPLVPLAALLAALDHNDDALPLPLPRAVGHYRRLEVCVHGVIRAVLTLTPRLAFITMQQCEAEAEAAGASSPARLVQVVLKLNDGTGFSAAQQAACKAQLRVGQRICLHAFVEINPPTTTPATASASMTAVTAAASSQVAVAAASSSAAVAASPPAALETSSLAWEVRSVAPIAAASCDQPLATAAAATDSAESAPLPPVEARLSLHAISVVLGSVAGAVEPDAVTGVDGAAPSTVGTKQCCQHATIHSARYAAALTEAAATSDAAAASAASAASSAEAAPAAAAESAAPAASSSESSPLTLLSPPRAFPDIALALHERVEMAAAAEAKRAAAAAAAAASNGSDPDRPLSVKEQQKLLNKERQKGDPRKRAPKCNSEWTRRNSECFCLWRAMTPAARV